MEISDVSHAVNHASLAQQTELTNNGGKRRAVVQCITHLHNAFEGRSESVPLVTPWLPPVWSASTGPTHEPRRPQQLPRTQMPSLTSREGKESLYVALAGSKFLQPQANKVD